MCNLVEDSKKVHQFASEILEDWKTVQKSPAWPYLRAMFQLNYVSDNYYLESGRDIISRFLCNAQYWRGPVAKRIKAELNELLSKQ